MSRTSRTLSWWLAPLALLVAAQPAIAIRLEASDAATDYQLLLKEGEFLEAADAIKRLITRLLQDPAHDRMAYGHLLTELATAQLHGGQPDAAVQNYLLAIETIENARDRLHDGLVTPLLGLSRSYAAMQHYPAAIDSYRRTLHVHEVNAGLHDEDKAKIIDELSEVYFSLGDFDEANAMQDWHVTIVERHHPGDDLARLESMYGRADMLSRTGRNYSAAEAYRRIIEMIEKADGPYSLELVPALGAISDLLASVHIMDGDVGGEKAVRYLRRAVAISERSTTASIPTKADTQILMGDFLSRQSPNRSAVLRYYQRGYDLLSSDPRHHERRERLFGKALHLNDPPPGMPPAMQKLLANAAAEHAAKNGRIIVRYDIDAGGRPANIRVVESVPEGLHDYMVVNHVRRFAFRPRFEDGLPVGTPDQAFALEFSYDEQALPEKVRQNTTEVASTDPTR